MSVVLDNRPTAHYRGDVSDAVGQLVGPTELFELLAVDEVTYDAAADRSTVRFRIATQADVDRHVTTHSVPAAFARPPT